MATERHRSAVELAAADKSAQKSRLLVWQWQSESLAEQANVVTVSFVDLVTRMELHEPHWIDAAHSSSRSDPSPDQMLNGVRHATHILASGIQDVGVNVESPVARVHEDEIAFPRVRAGSLMKSASRHQVA